MITSSALLKSYIAMATHNALVIALQGEDRTARAPGPLTLSQYEIAAFLNMSRQWICTYVHPLAKLILL